MNDQDELTLLLIKGSIADLPAADQARVQQAAQQLRDVVEAAGDHGVMAMALVGAELQVMSL